MGHTHKHTSTQKSEQGVCSNPLVHTIYLKTIHQSTPLRTQSSLLNLVRYHLDQKINITNQITIMIEIKLTDLEIMIGTLKLQDITQEVTLEGNIPKIIEISMPTPLMLSKIIQEITQEVTPEGDTQISNTGHIVEIKIKDINLGAHSVDMTILGIHTQIETTTDQEIDSEMDHTTTDQERDSEMNHKRDMRVMMIKGINLKKETPHIQEEVTAKTEPQPTQQEKEIPHIQGEEALLETETAPELFHEVLTNLKAT